MLIQFIFIPSDFLSLASIDDLTGGFVDLETGEVHGQQDDSNEESDDSEGSKSASDNGSYVLVNLNGVQQLWCKAGYQEFNSSGCLKEIYELLVRYIQLSL